MKKQCSNCEFNFDGICAGGGDVYEYGEKISDDTKCCENWGANLEYFHDETTNAPRFLRELYKDCSITYNEFSKRVGDYSSGKDVPVNLFDAIKYVYGLSMVDIAVIMDVSFGVVYNAKINGIPFKRMNQFSTALCVEPETLSQKATSVLPLLKDGKEKFFNNAEIIKKIEEIPEWKQNLANIISSEYLHCPIHLAKTFARVDKLFWTSEMPMDEFTVSERQLIEYVKKHNIYRKPLIEIEYALDRACQPHIRMMLKTK